MAVTKIRKVSSWTLLISSLISIVVLGLFYGGGVVDPSVEMKEPVNTGILIDWMFVMFTVTVVSMVVFALWQFVTLLKTNAKSGFAALIVVVCFAAMLFITYAIGDTTPLTGLNADSQAYNIPLWLKVTDMWIYSSIILMALIILSVVLGSVKKIMNK